MATHAAFMPGERSQSSVRTWLTTVDHKRIGILYGGTSFAFFLLAGLESLLMRIQLARPDNTLVGAQASDAGWSGYANLTSLQFSPASNLDFWILAIQILGVSSILGALNFIVTIINMRAPGMTLMRMPVFVWMVLITQFLVLLAFPALTVGMILLMFDRFFGTLFFVPAAGGQPLLWQHLFWIFGHPEVYILILSQMEIISELIPVFADNKLFC